MKILAVQGNSFIPPTYTRTDNARRSGIRLQSTEYKTWERKRIQRNVDLAHFKGVMLYDKDKKRVDEYLDYIDPSHEKLQALQI